MASDINVEVYNGDPVAEKAYWNEGGLVDGRTSRGAILPLRVWLAGLARQFEVRKEKEDLTARREFLLERSSNVLIGGCVVGGLLVAICVGFWVDYMKRKGRLIVQGVREQIAVDLHDDIGSNLGTVSLLSDRLMRQLKKPEGKVRPDDVSKIRRLARESAVGIKHIVWLTAPNVMSQQPMAMRLRETVTMMLPDLESEFVTEGALDQMQLEPRQRRAGMLFYKEALHNVLKHAAASKVVVSASWEPVARKLRLSIKDDGQGIEPEVLKRMGTLYPLRQRAEELDGTFEVETKPGEGTLVSLSFIAR